MTTETRTMSDTMTMTSSTTHESRYQSPFIERAGVRLFVRDESAAPGRRHKPPLVLLHGLGLSSASWDLVADYLLGWGHRVIRFDLRGHGRSAAPDSGYALDDLTADVIAVLDALDVPHAHLAGHSLGGTVGVQVALTAPERVSSLTLLGALVAGQAPPPAFMAWAGEVVGLMSGGLPALLEALPETALYAHRLTDPALVAAVRHQIRTSLNAAAFIPENFNDAQSVGLAPHSPWERIRVGELALPVLTVDGSEDPVVAGLGVPTSAQVPGAQGVTLAGAGHLAMLEQPATVARHLHEFVSKHQT